MEKRNDRVYVWAVIVANIFVRPDGKIFFVKRKGKELLTFPTEGIKAEEVRDISPAAFREAKEEIFKKFGNGLPRDSVKEILTVSVRPGEDPEKSNLIIIFIFEVDDETANMMEYEELGETLFAWIDPSLALRLPLANPVKEIPNMPLDELGKDGLARYLEKYPSYEEKKEEGYDETKLVEIKQGIRIFLQKLSLIFKKPSP
jgi:ADP-ribose pyrophosphatase YjhB (NUDIX family)